MEPAVQRAVDVSCRAVSLQSACFHHALPTLYLASDRTLMAVDIVCGAVIGEATLTTSWGRVQFLAHAPSSNTLCAFCETGMLATWEADDLVLQAAWAPDTEETRKPQPWFSCCAVSVTQPLSFHCVTSTRYIVVTDLMSRTSYKMRGSKKPIAALAVHPQAPVLASCSVEGEIRLWDYENQTVLSVAEGALPPSPKYLLTFSCTGKHLIATCSAGYACIWSCASFDDGSYAFIGSNEVRGIGTEGLWALPAAGSNQRGVVVTLDDRGSLSAWDISPPPQQAQAAASAENPAGQQQEPVPRQSCLQPSVRVAGCSLAAIVERAMASTIPLFAFETRDGTPAIRPVLVAHPTAPTLVALPVCVTESAGCARIHVVSLKDNASPPCSAVAPLHSPTVSEVSWGGRTAFTYSSADSSDRAFFLGSAGMDLFVCSASGTQTQRFRSLGRIVEAARASDAVFTRAVRLVRSHQRALVVTVFETSNALSKVMQATHHCVCVSSRTDDPVATISHSVMRGRDAAFLGPGDEYYALLADDGTSIALCRASSCLTPSCTWRPYQLPTGCVVDRIFRSINENSLVIVRTNSQGKTVVAQASMTNGFTPSGHSYTALPEGENVLQMEWQQPAGAILTTVGRVIIVTPSMIPVAVVNISHPITSIHWAGRALLATTETQVWACSVDGSASRVLTLHHRRSVIGGVLPDRLLLVCCGNASASRNGSYAYARPLSLAEPLTSAEITFSSCHAFLPSPPMPHIRARDELAATLSQLLSRFEWQRASAQLVEQLITAGCGDIAHVIAQRFEPVMPRQLLFEASLAALQFDQALAMLHEDSKASLDWNRGATVSTSAREHPLRARFFALAEICYEFGQYDIARKCIEAAGDPLALLHHQAIVSSSTRGVSALQVAVATEAPMATACQVLLSSSALSGPVRVTERVPIQCTLYSEKPATSQQSRAVATINGRAIPPMWVDQLRSWFPEVRPAEENAEDLADTAVQTSAQPVKPEVPAGASSAQQSKWNTTLQDPILTMQAMMDYRIPALVSGTEEQTSVVEQLATQTALFAKNTVADDDEPSVPEGELTPPTALYVKKSTAPFVPQPFIPNARVRQPTSIRRKPGTMPLSELGVPATASERKNSRLMQQPQLILQAQGPPLQVTSLLGKKQDSPAVTPPAEQVHVHPPPSPGCSTPTSAVMQPVPRQASPDPLSELAEAQPRDFADVPACIVKVDGPSPSPVAVAPPPRHKEGVRRARRQQTVSSLLADPALKGLIRSPENPSRTASPKSRSSHDGTRGSASPSRQALDPPEPVGPPPTLPLSPVAAWETPEFQDLKRTMMQLWQKRQHDLCLETSIRAIKVLSEAFAAQVPDHAAVELRVLVSYRVAVSLLRMIITLSAEPMNTPNVALLTKFLADVPLSPPHRVDCIRLAIEKNIEACNFGVAASLLQVLLPHPLPDSEDLAEKFKVCKSHKWANTALPTYLCPACQQPTSVANVSCECGAPIKFCSAQFRLLEGPTMLHCGICDSSFNLSSGVAFAGSRCPLCESSEIVELPIEAPPAVSPDLSSTTPPGTTPSPVKSPKLSSLEQQMTPRDSPRDSGSAAMVAALPDGRGKSSSVSQWSRTSHAQSMIPAQPPITDIAGSPGSAAMAHHRLSIALDRKKLR